MNNCPVLTEKKSQLEKARKLKDSKLERVTKLVTSDKDDVLNTSSTSNKRHLFNIYLRQYAREYSVFAEIQKEYEKALEECTVKQAVDIEVQKQTTAVVGGTGTSAGLGVGVIGGAYGTTLWRLFLKFFKPI